MEPGFRTCGQVVAEIARALQAQNPATLSPAACQHLSACSRCRAGLLVLLRAFDPKPDRLATSEDCAPCQADLAAFIDLEITDPVLAAATYPHVWWHLWICGTCSQTYEGVRVLLDAQQSGELPPFRLPAPAPQRGMPVVRRITLTRQALTLALPVRQAPFTVTRGAGDDSYVLYDEAADEPEQRRFTIVVQEQPEGRWQMSVSVWPPLAGLLVLSIGSVRLAAPFAPNGTATIHDLAPQVLTDPTAPNLEISIVPVEED
jgi:hypothetical protein